MRGYFKSLIHGGAGNKDGKVGVGGYFLGTGWAVARDVCTMAESFSTFIHKALLANDCSVSDPLHKK